MSFFDYSDNGNGQYWASFNLRSAGAHQSIKHQNQAFWNKFLGFRFFKVFGSGTDPIPLLILFFLLLFLFISLRLRRCIVQCSWANSVSNDLFVQLDSYYSFVMCLVEIFEQIKMDGWMDGFKSNGDKICNIAHRVNTHQL